MMTSFKPFRENAIIPMQSIGDDIFIILLLLLIGLSRGIHNTAIKKAINVTGILIKNDVRHYTPEMILKQLCEIIILNLKR